VVNLLKVFYKMYTDISSAQKRIPNMFAYVEISQIIAECYRCDSSLGAIPRRLTLAATDVHQAVIKRELDGCPEVIKDSPTLLGVYGDMYSAAIFALSQASDLDRPLWEALITALGEVVVKFDSSICTPSDPSFEDLVAKYRWRDLNEAANPMGDLSAMGEIVFDYNENIGSL
jgi:hypothetical protein